MLRRTLENLSGRRGVLLRTGARLEVVGRTKNVIKLNNGEFVSPEHIEKTLHVLQILLIR